jgi:hypothetical protein
MQNTPSEGVVKDGNITNFNVTPESRRKEVNPGKGWIL